MTVKIPNIAVRGIRNSIPPGYVLGRVDAGTGAVQLIPLAKMVAQMIAGGLIPPPGAGSVGNGTQVLTTEAGDDILQEKGDYITLG